MSEVTLALDEEHVRKCWPAIRELRPYLRSEDAFIDRWRIQQQEGYRLIHIGFAAVAGFRIMNTLAWGRALYLDDLVTLPEARGKGLAAELLDYLALNARHMGCASVHLDTGYEQHQAHRVCLRTGLEMVGHHMSARVGH